MALKMVSVPYLLVLADTDTTILGQYRDPSDTGIGIGATLVFTVFSNLSHYLGPI